MSTKTDNTRGALVRQVAALTLRRDWLEQRIAAVDQLHRPVTESGLMCDEDCDICAEGDGHTAEVCRHCRADGEDWPLYVFWPCATHRALHPEDT